MYRSLFFEIIIVQKLKKECHCIYVRYILEFEVLHRYFSPIIWNNRKILIGLNFRLNVRLEL